jgi:HB1, ASXL, restriction endonuclease HTH domain
MHTESNPQQPASTAPTADLPEATTPPKEATPEPTTAKKREAAKKPDAKTQRAQRATAKPSDAKQPATNDGQAAKTTDKTPSRKPTTTASAKEPREGSTMWAILKVLGSAKEPLSAKDIYAEIAKRKLAPGLKGKTPDQTIAAKLAISAKNGEYVERAAPGKFQLLKERS